MWTKGMTAAFGRSFFDWSGRSPVLTGKGIAHYYFEYGITSQSRLDTTGDTIYNDDRVMRMSQFDKLLQRINSLDKGLRFDELRKVLEYYGYEMSGPTGGSSHKTFRKPGHYPITIPQHEPIKRTYVELVKAIVENEDNSDE